MKILVLLLVGVPLFSYTTRSLDNLLNIAEKNSKKLQSAKKEIELANTRLIRSTRDFLPRLMFQRRFSRGRVSVTNEEYQGEDIGLRLAQPIYEGGRLRSTYRYDKLSLSAARMNYTRVKEELFYEVKVAYYQMLSSRMILHNLIKHYEIIEKLYYQANKEYESKAISKLEIDKAENLFNQYKFFIDSAKLELSAAEKKLLILLNIENLDDIGLSPVEKLNEEPKEIGFSLNECINLVLTNNVEINIYKLFLEMSKQKKIVARAKNKPKIFTDFSYGRSGEAFVKDPLELATVWTIRGGVRWTFWGSTTELDKIQEKAIPRQIMDVSHRTETDILDIRFSLFDDVGYFVEVKESDVSESQIESQLKETIDKAKLGVINSFTKYQISTKKIYITKQDLSIKEREIDLLLKRNALGEISTIDAIDGVVKYANSVEAYIMALLENYIVVAELEKLIGLTLR